MKKIIILSGKARQGKDEAATHIMEYLKENDKKCVKFAYGDFIKFVLRKAYNWDGEKDTYGRTLLQTVGTDISRKNNPGIWTRMMVDIIKALQTEFDYFIITDARIPEEIDEIKKNFNNILVVRVERPGYNSFLTDEQKNHITETGLDNYKFDNIMKNKDLEELTKNCKVLVQKIIR